MPRDMQEVRSPISAFMGTSDGAEQPTARKRKTLPRQTQSTEAVADIRSQRHDEPATSTRRGRQAMTSSRCVRAKSVPNAYRKAAGADSQQDTKYLGHRISKPLALESVAQIDDVGSVHNQHHCIEVTCKIEPPTSLTSTESDNQNAAMRRSDSNPSQRVSVIDNKPRANPEKGKSTGSIFEGGTPSTAPDIIRSCSDVRRDPAAPEPTSTVMQPAGITTQKLGGGSRRGITTSTARVTPSPAPLCTDGTAKEDESANAGLNCIPARSMSVILQDTSRSGAPPKTEQSSTATSVTKNPVKIKWTCEPFFVTYMRDFRAAKGKAERGSEQPNELNRRISPQSEKTNAELRAVPSSMSSSVCPTISAKAKQPPVPLGGPSASHIPTTIQQVEASTTIPDIRRPVTEARPVSASPLTLSQSHMENPQQTNIRQTEADHEKPTTATATYVSFSPRPPTQVLNQEHKLQIKRDAEYECRLICLEELSKARKTETIQEPYRDWKTKVASEAKMSPVPDRASLPDVVPQLEVRPGLDVAPGLGVPSTKKLAPTSDTRLCASPDISITGLHDVNQTNHMAPKQPRVQDKDQQLAVKDITRTDRHIVSYTPNVTVTPSITAGIEYWRHTQANAVGTDTADHKCAGTRTNDWILHRLRRALIAVKPMKLIPRLPNLTIRRNMPNPLPVKRARPHGVVFVTGSKDSGVKLLRAETNWRQDADIPASRADSTATSDSGIDTEPDDVGNGSKQSRQSKRAPVDKRKIVDTSLRQDENGLDELPDKPKSPAQRLVCKGAAGRKKKPQYSVEHKEQKATEQSDTQIDQRPSQETPLAEAAVAFNTNTPGKRPRYEAYGPSVPSNIPCQEADTAHARHPDRDRMHV